MKELLNWAVSEIGIPVLCGIVGYKVMAHVFHQKIAGIVTSIVVGALALYFIKNPESALSWFTVPFNLLFGKK